LSFAIVDYIINPKIRHTGQKFKHSKIKMYSFHKQGFYSYEYNAIITNGKLENNPKFFYETNSPHKGWKWDPFVFLL
jgi:hypothetical protein